MYMSDKDRVLLRTKDVSIIILICTVLGLIGTQLKKVYRWDEAVERVEKLESRVRQAENVNIAVVARLDEISKQLDQANFYLRRMERGRNP